MGDDSWGSLIVRLPDYASNNDVSLEKAYPTGYFYEHDGFSVNLTDNSSESHFDTEVFLSEVAPRFLGFTDEEAMKDLTYKKLSEIETFIEEWWSNVNIYSFMIGQTPVRQFMGKFSIIMNGFSMDSLTQSNYYPQYSSSGKLVQFVGEMITLELNRMTYSTKPLLCSRIRTLPVLQ